MAFFDFFWKKVRYYADTRAENVISGIHENFTETNERLRRIEAKQKETSIQLEEIDDFLQSNGNETVFIDALMALTDTIADFYFFAGKDEDAPLFEQARMMWNRAKSAVESAGLSIIDAGNEAFDFRLHSAENVEQDLNIPNGYIIKTLKFGYIYRNEVVRRAAVVINKIEKIEDKADTESQPPDIIYL
jgi:molecular chaperone GrpE (heat shock protein)